MRKLHVLLLLACATWSLSGCDSSPRVVPAEGTVTLKGAALPGASITVVYPDGDSATGVSDNAGKFALSYGARSGALPGADLKVAVVKVSSGFVPTAMPADKGGGSGPPSEEQLRELMKEATKTMAQKAGTKVDATPKNELDRKYQVPDTSGLKLTIPEGGSKDLKIELP